MKVIAPPDVADAILSVEECRAHLEAQPYVDSDVDPIDDQMIEGWRDAAVEYCEQWCGQSFTLRTLEIALDSFPCGPRFRAGISLPMGPVREVLTVSWGDESDQELADLDFALDSYTPFARLYPTATNWPSLTAATNLVKIRYRAGYGNDTDLPDPIMPLPRSLRAAVLLILGHLYANREETTDVALAKIPLGAAALMQPFRVRLGFA